MVAAEDLGGAFCGAQLAVFDRNHRFRGPCGRPATPNPVRHARVCTGGGAPVNRLPEALARP